MLRTDLYERSSGREYVYVKFRCRRCKRMGEVFVAERQWDWSIFEPARNEMSDTERDGFLDQDAISVAEIILFHRQLKAVERVSEMQEQAPPAVPPQDSPQDADALAEPSTLQSTAPPGPASKTDDLPGDASGRNRTRAKEQPARDQTNKTSKNNKDTDSQPPAGDLPSATA
ncbi:MAG TPA: hypothetical protein VNA16_09735 [Abditibacteriaceae bacterium]|nr:hypothetical protein [Abditibacteriaceae bacterium]